MEHVIKGKKFCITGSLQHYTRTTAQRAIVDAGGTIAKSVGPRTDFLVCGSGAGSKLTKARSLGIPVIEEADLESFLAGEVVEVDEEVMTFGEASVRDLIGEARAALDGHPDSEMWSEVVAIVDSCAPDQLGALVDFLEPQVARWTIKPDKKWAPRRGSRGVEDAPRWWVDAIPVGELRVAPHHWLIEMITKHDSPKYRLVHAVHLTGMKVSGTAAASILERADLTNLRRLDVDQTKLTATFWKKLRTLPSTQGLERLRFAVLDAKSVKGVPGTHHLDALREVTFIDKQYYREDGSIDAFLHSDLMRGVRALNISGSSVPKIAHALADETVLPELETLGVETHVSDHIRAMIGSVAARRVGRVDVTHNLWFYRLSDDVDLEDLVFDMLEPWTKGVQAGPAHLDLSNLTIDDRDPRSKFALSKAALAGAISRWRLPPATTSMSFGRWYSADLKERLAARGVTATR